jgi:hypothetical protein
MTGQWLNKIKKGRAGGVARVVERFPSKLKALEFKPHNHQNKYQNREKEIGFLFWNFT